MHVADAACAPVGEAPRRREDRHAERVGRAIADDLLDGRLLRRLVDACCAAVDPGGQAAAAFFIAAVEAGDPAARLQRAATRPRLARAQTRQGIPVCLSLAARIRELQAVFFFGLAMADAEVHDLRASCKVKLALVDGICADLSKLPVGGRPLRNIPIE